MATEYRVRALKTIRVAAEDEPKYPGIGRRWHVPGLPSAKFTCGEERYRNLRGQHAVAPLEHYEEDDEVETDDAPEGLPLDFPYRELLVGGGLNTLSDVREMPDLTEINGIGEASAKRIADELAELGDD